MRAILRPNMIAPAVSLVMLAVVLAFFLLRAWHGLWFLGFVDESEHLVGGQMLNHGARLYQNYVDQHGPVIFILTQFFGAITGWGAPGSLAASLEGHFGWFRSGVSSDRAAFLAAHFTPNLARLYSILLALVTLWLVALTPTLRGLTEKLCAALLFCGLITSPWLVQGLYLVNYHAIGGFFLAIGLVLYIIPAWQGLAMPPWRGIGAGFSLAIAAGIAYPDGLSGALMGAGGFWAAWQERDNNRRWLPLGALVGAGLIGLWMARFASFTGYLAFHIVENQRDYAAQSYASINHFFDDLIPRFVPDQRIQAMGLLCAYIAFGLSLAQVAAKRQWRLAGPTIIAFAGILLLCGRCSPYFHNGEFLIVSIAWASVAIPQSLRYALSTLAPRWHVLAPVCLVVPIGLAEWNARLANYTPFNIRRAEAVLIGRQALGLADDPLSLRMHQLTRDGDRILALPFVPTIYLFVGRPPMDRYYYYFPWDAAYARAPVLGQTHDLCVDLPKDPPALIFYNRARVAGGVLLTDYAPCFNGFFRDLYVEQPGVAFDQIYLRRDLALRAGTPTKS